MGKEVYHPDLRRSLTSGVAEQTLPLQPQYRLSTLYPLSDGQDEDRILAECTVLQILWKKFNHHELEII